MNWFAAAVNASKIANVINPNVFATVIVVPDNWLSQFTVVNANFSPDGPSATSMWSPGIAGTGAESSCKPDENRALTVVGGGNTTVTVHGAAERFIDMASLPTGVAGLAGLYGSVLVVDMTNSSWSGTDTDLKGDPGNPLPRPDMSTVGENDVQPRPGNMPGQYIYQFGDTFYHYGGPLESGANPQSTAVYADGDVLSLPGQSFAAPPVIYFNTLSGAQLWHYAGALPPYIEVKHVDGSVARFTGFVPSSHSYWQVAGRAMWRLTSVRDPYDNVATYTYNASHQLTQVVHPSGLSQHWNYAPSWGFGSSYSCIEVSYQQNGSAPAEVAARTWGLVFSGTLGTSGGRFFGSRLHRTYSPQFSMLTDVTGSPHTLAAGTEVTAQVVHQFTYDAGASTVTETQKIHSGTPFQATLTTPSGLADVALVATVFGSSGRAIAQTRSLVGETLTFSYPASQRTMDIVSGDLPTMAAIEVVAASGARRRYEYSRKSGRVYSVITRPNDGTANSTVGRPRAAHLATENSGIGGVAATDVEPDSLTTYNIYDATCVCQKPIERREIAVRGGATTTRTWNFEYDPVSRLLTKRKEPNPQTGTGPFQPVEWTYSYTQAKTTGQFWGAWLPAQETTPDGNYTYSYSEWLDRADAASHGRIAGTVTRQVDAVRRVTSLAGATVTGSPVIWKVHRNLSNSPGGLGYQGPLSGQPRRVFDGDGVSTVYEYGSKGYVLSETVDGSVQSTYSYDAIGNVIGVTSNATSTALTGTTTLTIMQGVGVPTTVSSTSGGLLREAKAWYDRFGHIVVVRQNNLASGPGNSKPSQYAGSSANARDWVENQFHYQHLRLMEIYSDRKPLDEAAGTGQFLVTKVTYDTDGRVSRVDHPNGSYTIYTFDGFGTVYRTITYDPTGTQSVRSPKTFVNPFLEMTGSYEHTGSDHLWTLIARNDAGAITSIQEPSTTAPGGYTHSTGGAVHRYQLDQLGRVTKAEAFDGPSSTTPLTSRKLAHDELHRQIWQQDDVLGFGSGVHQVAWQYVVGKASQLLSVESTAVGPTSYGFNSLGLLASVNDAIGNQSSYSYHSNTAFLAHVTQTDVDGAGTRVTHTGYEVDAFGHTVAIKQELGPGQLVHTYGYDSLGRVDLYTDPAGKQQKFLLDALGRIVEHVRVGSGNDFIRNSTVYQDSGVAADGRTKMLKYDGADNGANNPGNVTVTHYDFAGRPFIVQNPGGNTAPTASNKHQSMSLYAEYDGASRLSALYDGDQGKTMFWRDGPGRVIQRQLDNFQGDKITLWNSKDVIRRDALGRMAQTDYWAAQNNGLLMGVEQFDQDSLGRVHAERFSNVFAPGHVQTTTSSYSGGSPFRTGVGYSDSMAALTSMTMARDAIGRLAQIDWNGAPGSSGSTMLAQYGWAGGLRRSRKVVYSPPTSAQGASSFSFDVYGRLLQIKDDVTPASGPTATKSQFDYEYDAASNLTKEKYVKVGGRAGDRFAYDAYHRLSAAWMGVDATTMAATANPGVFDPNKVHEQLTYGLDGANNRTQTSSQTGATAIPTDYTRQNGSNPQGASNRYASMMVQGAVAPVTFEYDERGNLSYDGVFVYRYDYMNRLQEVWRVVPTGEAAGEGEKFAVVNEGSLDEAQEAVKLEVPDLYSRLMREHTNPTFRNRLKATIDGGVIRITPTAPGGGMPSFVRISGTLELAAVYVYDVFNRRVLSALVDPSFSETQIHTWDGWRQTVQSRLEFTGTAWVAAPQKQFVWGATLDEMVAYRRPEVVGSATVWKNYYLLHGGQDTAAKLVDEAGAVVEQYEYDPYGRVTVYDGGGALATPGNGRPAGSASAKGLPFLWKSIRLDEITGLLQMRNRYYSTGMGRFMSRDPKGVWADIYSNGNECCYAGERGLVIGDPLGLQGGFGIGQAIDAAAAMAIAVAQSRHRQDVAEAGQKMKDIPSGGEAPSHDPKAGELEKVGHIPVKSGKSPNAGEIAKSIDPDWYYVLCKRGSGGNETAGVVLLDQVTGDVYVVREGRNNDESPSGSRRLWCDKRAKYLESRLGGRLRIVAGFHTHPSRGTTTAPSPSDQERAREDNRPEIIATSDSIAAHTPVPPGR